MKRQMLRLMKSIFEAKNLAEVMQWLKEEHNYSNEQLAERIGDIGQTTIWRLLHGEIPVPEPKTLDQIAQYAHVPREWLYGLAYNLQERPVYSKRALAVLGMLESLSEETQENFFVQVRAVVDRRKKLDKTFEQPDQ